MENIENIVQSSKLYDAGKARLNRGELLQALQAFEQSSRLFPHFKTLELQGQCYLELKRFSEAIIFLAAATSLNRGLRAPLLLIEALLQTSDVKTAKDIAKIVLQRDPNHERAKAILELQ